MKTLPFYTSLIAHRQVNEVVYIGKKNNCCAHIASFAFDENRKLDWGTESIGRQLARMQHAVTKGDYPYLVNSLIDFKQIFFEKLTHH